VRVDRRELAAVFAGGVLGALARAGLVEALPHGAILVANLIGTFALGYFVTRLQERLPLSAYRRPFLGTGVCGALTTFSKLQVELLDMDPGPAIAYALVSVIAGFAAVALATNLVRAG
jgi:fluoride exporter